MKTLLLCGAVAVCALSAADSSLAKTYRYGFYTPSGSPYCDGVEFTGDRLGAAGVHVYDQTNCVFPDGVLGGFGGTVPALGPGWWFTFPVSQAAGDLTPPAVTPAYYINVRALTWGVAYESTDYDIPFQGVFNGILMKGKPAAHARPGQKNLGAVLRQTLALRNR